MTLPALLSAAGLGRSYTVGSVEVHALFDVDLSVCAGAIVALVGPSGSGKSTLLNLVGGLDRPTTGQLLVNGRDLRVMRSAQLARYRRTMVGFVFQAYRLLEHLTALENVALPLLLSGLDRAPAHARAELLLERVGLSARRHHRPTQLSGGEQQRVAVARALANSPRLLLADEPTGNLDTAAAGALLELLVDLNRAEGLTLIMATHNAELAARANQVVELRGGQLAWREEAA